MALGGRLLRGLAAGVSRRGQFRAGQVRYGGAVVVGVDGSAESLDAVRTAATSARLRQRPLVIVHDAFPGTAVDTLVRHDRPARTSLDAAAADSAQLLVVGARGRGGFDGLAWGSTASTLSAAAACPVLIARTTPNLAGRQTDDSHRELANP